MEHGKNQIDKPLEVNILSYPSQTLKEQADKIS